MILEPIFLKQHPYTVALLICPITSSLCFSLPSLKLLLLLKSLNTNSSLARHRHLPALLLIQVLEEVRVTADLVLDAQVFEFVKAVMV